MNKNLLSWLLYDAGNSFLQVALGGLYFTQWIIIDNKIDDIWYSLTFSGATFLVLITSPFWGSWSDRLKRRMPFISGLTLFMFFLNILLVIFVAIFTSKTKVIAALILFFLIQYFYQLSLIFYNALLEHLSDNKTRGKISGLGQAFGDIGWILATVALFPFAQGKITLWGQPGKSQIFLPALVICVLLCMPMLILFKEKPFVLSKFKKPADTDSKSIAKKTISGLKELFKSNKNVGLFLLAFCLISDAILTIQLYFAVIVDRLYHVPDSQKLRFLLLMFIFNVAGDYLLGKASDSFGAKKTIFLSTLLLIVIFSLGFLSSAPWFLYPLALFAGIGWGGFYSASRALLIKISPEDRLGEYFGFYSTFQKFASIVGPLVWGLTVLIFRNYGTINYRLAGFLMIFLMGAGLLFLRPVQEKKVIL